MIVERIKSVLIKAGLEDLPEDIQEDLADYGMDSLMMVLSLGGIEKEFGIRVPVASFKPEAFSSIAALKDFLQTLGVE